MAAKPKKPEDDDETTEFALTDEHRAEIGNMVNSAVTTQLKRQLGQAIKSAVEPQMAEIKALLSKRGAPEGDDVEDPDEDADPDAEPAKPAKGKLGKPAPVTDPKIEAKAQKQLRSMQAKLDAIEAERRTEREQTQASQRDTSLRELLTKGNVKPELMRGALLAIRENTKRDEKTGEWSYIVKKDGFDEELDLPAAVDGWLKSDEGKAHVAAPVTQPRVGSGMPRVNGPAVGASLGRTQPSADPKAVRASAVQQAEGDLASAIGSLLGGSLPVA